MSPTPTRVDIRAYNVGFGDSFLLSFDYADPLPDGRSERHMLVDCGSTKRDPRGPSIAEVAELIAQDCNGHLDVLVVTHRHRDHLSAFQNQQAVTAFDQLQPKYIVRPWTDDPDAPIDARGPSRPLDDASRRYITSLQAGHEAAAIIGSALREAAKDTRSLRGELGALALDEIANLDAVTKLEAYATAGDADYVAYGEPTRINHFIPGLEVDVLGPPTVAQWPEVARQVDEHSEFWMLGRRLVEAGFTERGIEPTDPNRWAALLQEDGSGPARWLLERLDEQRMASLLRIVRSLDDALNNTSLILLMQVGDRRMLFTGDAQIENWSYVLESPDVSQHTRDRLAELDLYKVGHHGSRNATPKSLFGLWEANQHPMVSLLSTIPGMHGKRAATAVPRATLVNALRDRTDLYNTDDLPDGETHIHLTATTVGNSKFEPA